MMDFITVPATVGIIFWTIYKTFELLIHRKERLMFIQKLSELSVKENINLSGIFGESDCGAKYAGLRFGCLFLGIGLGLLVGYYLTGPGMFTSDMRSFASIAIGASVLLCGGAGLLCSFLVEHFMRKK